MIIRKLKDAAKGFLLVSANHIIAPAEWYCLRGINPCILHFPPIFVIGPPRSGTTLVSQILLASLDLGCLTNAMAAFYLAPYFIGKLSMLFVRSKETNFTSHYGRVKGLGGPNEGVRFWSRWFTGDPSRHLIGGFNGKPATQLRKEIVAITHLFGKPVLFKNPYNSNRIIPLNRVFPEAIFIEVSRDLISTASSILRARIDRYGDKTSWFGPGVVDQSVRNIPYWKQVVEQTLRIQNSIKDARDEVGAKKFFIINYSDICKNPAREIDRIYNFLHANNCKPIRKKIQLKPLPVSNKKRVSDHDMKLMMSYINQISTL
ncbi:MAG: sulfotransferase [Candidatus Hodarchaeota archaeon]